MLYSIKKFKKEHLDIFEPRDIIKPEIDYLKEQMSAIKEWETISPVFTLFADEKPIMIYGLLPEQELIWLQFLPGKMWTNMYFVW